MSIRLIASLLLFVMIGGIANAEESKQKTVKSSTELSEAFGKESLPGDQFDPKSLPGDQFDPKALPGDQFDPKSLPGDQFDPKVLPGDQFDPKAPDAG